MGAVHVTTADTFAAAGVTPCGAVGWVGAADGLVDTRGAEATLELTMFVATTST